MEREGNVEKAILAEMKKPRSGLIDRVTSLNRIILHNFKKAVERSCECRLMGCPQTFPITLVPNQVLYPKYCPDHRSEFRRQDFLRRFTGQPGVYRVGPVDVLEPTPPPHTPL
jgi:hypothetical protein